mmetsp:Transcript_17857/g.33648  ORF Transcript_17857/g.33648 Transcript_17857/m.33648 type:complete len:334 (+) Transcript_17857:65-1066(+)
MVLLLLQNMMEGIEARASFHSDTTTTTTTTTAAASCPKQDNDEPTASAAEQPPPPPPTTRTRTTTTTTKLQQHDNERVAEDDTQTLSQEKDKEEHPPAAVQDDEENKGNNNINNGDDDDDEEDDSFSSVTGNAYSSEKMTFAANDNKTKKAHQRCCRFGTVRVAYYLMTVGSNPGGSEGVPIELGELDVEQTYASPQEYQRALHGGKEEEDKDNGDDDDNNNDHDNDHHRPARRLTKEHRRQICEAAGVPDSQITQANREAYLTRLARLRSSREDEEVELQKANQVELEAEAKQQQRQQRGSCRHPTHQSSSAVATKKKSGRIFSVLRSTFTR